MSSRLQGCVLRVIRVFPGFLYNHSQKLPEAMPHLTCGPHWIRGRREPTSKCSPFTLHLDSSAARAMRFPDPPTAARSMLYPRLTFLPSSFLPHLWFQLPGITFPNQAPDTHVWLGSPLGGLRLRQRPACLTPACFPSLLSLLAKAHYSGLIVGTGMYQLHSHLRAVGHRPSSSCATSSGLCSRATTTEETWRVVQC